MYLLAEEQKPACAPQRIARAEPNRPPPESGTRLEQHAKNRSGTGVRTKQFHPVFAGIAGARDRDLDAGDAGVCEAKRAQRAGVDARARALEQLERSRALHGDQRRLIAFVPKLGSPPQGIAEVRGDFGAIAGIAYDQHVVFGAAVDDEIVEDGSARVAAARVERLAVLRLR